MLKYNVNNFLLIYSRITIGLCLVAAALLKAVSRRNATLFPMLTAVEVPWPVVAVGECAVGLCVALDPRIRRWRIVTAGSFSLFAVWSAAAVVEGRTSCGCFGTVAIPPGVMLAIDLMIATGVALAVAGDTASAVHSPRRALWGRSLRLAVLIGGASALAVTTSYAVGMQAKKSNRPVPRLADWLGKPAPFLDALGEQPEGASLNRGEWLVILWRPGCGRCQEAITDYADVSAGTGLRLALVRIGPPDGPTHEDAAARAPGAVRFELPTDGWAEVLTPVVVHMVDGVVVTSLPDGGG